MLTQAEPARLLLQGGSLLAEAIREILRSTKSWGLNEYKSRKATLHMEIRCGGDYSTIQNEKVGKAKWTTWAKF